MTVVVGLQVNVELRSGDAALLRTSDVDVVAIKVEFNQFLFQAVRVESKIKQRADKHITTYSAKEIQVKSAHSTS